MFAIGSLGSWVASGAAACACSCCTLATREALKSSARVAFSVLFTFSLLLSWVLRDFAKPIISKIPWIMHSFPHGEPPEAWFGQQAVYRLSMGNFLLFSGLGIVMCFPAPVKYQEDWRDRSLHHGGWPLKVVLWLLCNIIPFFFPNPVVGAYAWVARIASPLFLGLQCLILIDVFHTWNESWVQEGEEDERYLWALLLATLIAFSGSGLLIGLSFKWFNPSDASDCSLNISLITMWLLLCIGFNLLTFHPAIRRANPSVSLFVGAATAFYVSWLGFSALQSEPRDYECNSIGKRLNAASGTTLAAGMAFTLISTVWAAFRAGSNARMFDLTGADSSNEMYSSFVGDSNNTRDNLLEDSLHEGNLTSAGLDGAESAKPPRALAMERPAGAVGASDGEQSRQQHPVSYNYVQFYAVFALASMYIAMLMTGWGQGIQKDLVDVGWTSVWVKIASQWLASGLYIWTLIAPVVLDDRYFV